MSWNNVLPVWLVSDLCRVCGKKLKVSRNEKPGQLDGCEKCEKKEDLRKILNKVEGPIE